MRIKIHGGTVRHSEQSLCTTCRYATVWILRTDAKRKRIGFVHARDLKPAERFVLPDEWPL